MGYYSTFSISATRNGVQLPEEELMEHMDDTPFDYEGTTVAWAKWYENEMDMETISKLHPDVVYRLHGIGEESDRDEWISFYVNGVEETHHRPPWEQPMEPTGLKPDQLQIPGV